MKNFTNHLKKLNKTRDGGTKPGYYYLLCAYVLNYLFNLPILANLRPGSNYRQKKKLFYTVMTGNYDHLNEITKPLPNWDYVCFTDNPDLQSRSWRIELLTNELDLDSIRLSRHYKINNHLVDSDYYLSVYVDGNMRIRGNLDNFVSQALPADKTMGVMLHPFHSSLAEEVEDCWITGKDDETLLREQYRYYVEERGFTDKNPHITARLMIRRSKDARIQELMEIWFSQLLRWSRRDQVAFNYSLGQCPDVTTHYIPYWLLRRYFKKLDHS